MPIALDACEQLADAYAERIDTRAHNSYLERRVTLGLRPNATNKTNEDRAMGQWKDAVVVITGAGSGIGRALAHELVRRGAIVHVTDVDGESAQAVAAEIGERAHPWALDVCDAEAVRARIEAIAADGRLDLLVNNAGIGVGGEVQELTLAHWDRVIDINLRGVIHGVMAAYPIMVDRGEGQILNVASLAGLAAAPLLTPYATTKHAVVGLSTSLRAEAKCYGVRVSALCPAAIETPILDSENPVDLPSVSWKPDTRRFLTKLSGRPYPVEKLAGEAVDALESNQAVIVIPGRARFGWRLGRLFPRLVEKVSVNAVAAERAEKP